MIRPRARDSHDPRAGSNIGTLTVSTVTAIKAKTARIKAGRKGAF